MLRVSLDDMVLQILLLDKGDPAEFLASAVNPPTDLAVANSIKYLCELQASLVFFSYFFSNLLSCRGDVAGQVCLSNVLSPENMLLVSAHHIRIDRDFWGHFFFFFLLGNTNGSCF